MALTQAPDPNQVAEATARRFTVCLVGEGEDESTFRETYRMADHGKEWRWPGEEVGASPNSNP